MVKGAADSTPAVRGLEPAMNALEAAALEEGCRTPPPAEAPEEPPEGTPPPKKRRARPPPPFSAATKEGALPDQQIFGGEGGEEDSSSAIVAVCGTTRVTWSGTSVSVLRVATGLHSLQPVGSKWPNLLSRMPRGGLHGAYRGA